MIKKISIAKCFPAVLVAFCAGALIAGTSGCSQERYEDSQRDEGTSSSSGAAATDGTTLPAVSSGTTLPASRGTTLPAGRGTTLPSGNGTTLP